MTGKIPMHRSTFLFVILAALVPGADAAGIESVTSAKPFSHSIAPRKIGEECFKLAAGQSIAYAFESSSPVDFNIHFHKGDEVVYPVKSDQVAKAEDRFTAPSAEEFCLMWTNKTLEKVTIRGQLRP
jgi:hypothetical protein